MTQKIQKAAVIGAGVMGSAIAGYLAGYGIPCDLLDIPAEGEDRDQISKNGIQKLLKTKPPYLFSPKDIRRIRPGNIEDHLERLKEADWIIEAVVEKLEVKRSLFEKIDEVRKEDSIVSSNTSGISLESMAEGRSESFRKHFLITHFFNPVRYMRLLEIVKGPETSQETVDKMVEFGQKKLGKGIVYAKDTPNFIANRIGVYGKMLVIQEFTKGDYTIEEIDKAFGPVIGRPKSAVFRTADIVGLDTTANVVNYLHSVLENDPEKEVFVLPEFYSKMLEKGMLGEKAKQGFYKVEKTKEGKKILALDLDTLEYREKQEVHSESLDRVKGISNLPERIRSFILYENDKLAKLVRKVTFKTLLYALSLIPEISDDIVNIDRAMKWGYNWEIGVFETWDALGVEESAKKMEEEGFSLPENLKKLLATPEKRFYVEVGKEKKYFDFLTSTYKTVPEMKEQLSLVNLHKQNKVVYHNPSASLVDLGDGVLGVEFHTQPINAIDDDVMDAMYRGADLAEREFKALVIGNEGSQFCAGANLMLIMMNIQAKNWDLIGQMVDRFQGVNQRMRYASVPVVAAPFGMTLGGGCEVCLGANHIHSRMELYMGLVEVGVGLIPAGAGCLNMLKRYLYHIPEETSYDPSAIVRHIFEIIGKATVSTSAKDAKRLLFLRPTDTITASPERQIFEAKQIALALAESYTPEEPWENIHLPGEAGFAALKYGLKLWKDAGVITEYDAVVGEKLAYILCGGKEVNFRTSLHENYILELEKEAFLSLCGEERTLARIQHMLMHKKPLRN